MLAFKRAPADHHTQAWGLGHTSGNIWIWHWWYIVAIPDPGVFNICAPDTDLTDDSHGDWSLTAGKKKQDKNKKIP